MKLYKTLVSTAIALVIIFTNKVPTLSTPYFYKITLDEGITFVHDTILNYDGYGNNQQVNYIELDFNNTDIDLSLIQANDVSSSKDTLLNQLKEERMSTGKDIIGGINGEFFQISSGQLLFTTISDSKIFSIIDSRDESLKRPVFFIDENRNYGFDYLTILGTLKFLDNKFDNLVINSLNKMDSYNDVNVSNYKINLNSTYYPHEGLPSRYMIVELTNSDGEFSPGSEIFGKIVEIGEMTEPKIINKNQLLITAYGENNYEKIKYDFLGHAISLRFDIFSEKNNTIKNDIVTAFTGHEYLIKNGQQMDNNYYGTLAQPSLINNKNSRTALGVTRDNKLILFTVDKSSESSGMTLNELSSHLQSLNIINAINLDGGGSTSISFENNEHKLFLMNDQNKYQRSIPNVISIVYNQKR